jgi:subtilisin family serine protease
MAPEAQLVIYKISAGGRGYTSDAIAAIDAAIGAGVDIINYSNSYSPREDVGKPPWVWPTELSEIERALVTAADHGILCVVAAGNDGPDLGSINRPAGIEEVLAIGAINSASEVTHQSSRGPYYTLRSLRRGGERRLDLATDRDYGYRKKPDVVAPGEEITGPRAQHGTIIDRDMLLDRTDPSCAYVRFGGTSHATAVVSGMAAAFLHLVRDRGIDLGPNRSATLRRLFRLSARKLPRGQEEEYGHGLVIWPVLTETLRDFVTDDDFRRTVLGGPGLTLLP